MIIEDLKIEFILKNKKYFYQFGEVYKIIGMNNKEKYIKVKTSQKNILKIKTQFTKLIKYVISRQQNSIKEILKC